MVQVRDNAGNRYNYLPIKCRARQEVFERVGHHLMKQENRAMVHDDCAHRADDGGKCAAGVLLEDWEVNEVNNVGLSWLSLATVFMGGAYAPTAAMLDRIPFMTELVSRLQDVHDNGHNWDDEKRPMLWALRDIALSFNLDATFLEAYFPDLSDHRD